MPERHPESIPDLIAALHEHGDHPALLIPGDEGLRSWSYAELARSVHRLAHGLTEHDVAQGDRVALFAANSPEWIIACLAIIEAGAIVVPIDAQFAEEQLEHVLGDAEPRIIFADARRAERLEPMDVDGPVYRLDLEEEADDARDWQDLLSDRDEAREPADLDATATLFYTSGTTGRPKGVPLTHANLASQFPVLRDAGLVRPDDRVCLPLPLHHVYAFVMGMLQPLAFGVPIVLPRSLSGPELIKAIHDGEATLMIGVPRLYRALYTGLESRAAAGGRPALWGLHATLAVSGGLRRVGIKAGKRLLAPLHRKLGPRLRLVASGGAAIDTGLLRRLEALGWDVAEGYGLTETSPLITLRLPQDGHIDTVGRAVEGVELRIDEEAAPEGSPPGAGEVLVRGPNVFAGYHELPDKTEEVLSSEGWYRTGDLGRLDDDGYLHLLGRVSEMIVTEGGENIQPDEVESAYEEQPVIAEMALLQHEDRLVGLIVPDTREAKASSEDLEDQVSKAVERASKDLPSYQRIGDFAITREALPRTRLGKLRRHRLSDRYEDARAGREREPGPMDIEDMSQEDRDLLDHPAAEAVWKWLAERFEDRPVTPDASLELDLGIDSMEWVSLTMEIAERAGIELPEEEVAEMETVRDLLQTAAEAAEGSAPDLSEDPEQNLEEGDRRWLRPLGPFERVLASLVYWINWGALRLLYRLEVRGTQHLPEEGQIVITPNHLSALDPFVLAAGLRRRRLLEIYWGGWVGIAFANPLTRAVSRLAKAVPIDPRRGAISSLALAAAVLKQGKGLIWFPEGERSPDGKLQQLKPGVGVLLDAQPSTVVPVAITGTRRALPPGGLVPRPFRRLRVVIGEPVDTGALADEGEGDDRATRIVAALQQRLEALVKEA